MTMLATSTFVQVLAALFIVVPVMIMWVAAVGDVVRRGGSGLRVAALLVLILIVPILGPLLYFALRRPELPSAEAAEAAHLAADDLRRETAQRPIGGEVVCTVSAYGAAHRAATPLAIVVATACAASMAGCGADTVDATAVEDEIEQELPTAEAKVSSVTCPTDVKSETGATFRCSVTWSNDAKGKVEVTQTSQKQFRYETVPGSVQIPGAEVEHELEQQLAQNGAAQATVTCPGTITVEVDTPVTCQAGGAGGQASGDLTFSFSTAEGTVDTSSLQTP